MTAITLGEGPRAIRLLFGEDHVQLRTYRAVIDGNADMACALQLVLNQEPHEAETPDVFSVDTVEKICRLLRELVAYGVPIELWGPAWAQRCVTGDIA